MSFTARSRGPVLVALVLLLAALALVATACSGAEEEVQEVEQELHDDVVAAYAEAKSFLASSEAKISDEAKAAWTEINAEFEKIEPKLEEAKDFVGNEAIKAYRDIQHTLHGLHEDADEVLHAGAHTVETAVASVWHEMKTGFREVHQAVDHVIDELHT